MNFDPTSFLFQLVNFGLLVWILQRVLYRPLRAGIEKRRAELASERAQAAAEKSAAAEIRRSAEARLGEIEKLRETIIADAREQAAKEEARILESARQDAGAQRERVQRTLKREREESLAWVREATIDNAVQVAGRLLVDLLPESADAVLLQALIASLAEHHDGFGKELHEAARAKGRLQAELCVARPPSDDDLKTLQQALDEICSAPCELVVREDDSLLAGPLLRVGDQVLDASVAGHLAVLRERARQLARAAETGDG